MATTFNAIYLGQFDIIDVNEWDTMAGDSNKLVGLTFGAEGAPLLNNFVTIAPVGDVGEYYDQSNWLVNDQFIVNGTYPLVFDAIVQYNATIEFVDDTQVTMEIAIFQDETGQTFMAPMASPGSAQDTLESAGIRSVTLNTSTNNNWDGMTASRETWDFATCFTPGTLIETDRGPRAIEMLEPGDRILTRDNGYQTLRWIGHKRVAATGAFAPIHIAANTFGAHEAITLSPEHRVLLSGWDVDVISGAPEVLCAAKHLVDGAQVTRREGGHITYYHMLFDAHEVVFANGLEAESFHPGEQAWGALSCPSRREILTLFPYLAALGLQSYGPTAYPVLRKFEARALMALRAPANTDAEQTTLKSA